MKLDVVVIGGGVTGLGAALRLNLDACLFEKDASLGGCLRSDRIQGYTVDRTGHLLHMQDPYVRQLMFDELQIEWLHFVRRAEVHLLGRRIPYPIQYHLHALPERERNECLRSFLSTNGVIPRLTDSFDEWSRHSYGDSLHSLFFEPYNRKLWQVHLSSITAEWTDRFVPPPDRELIVRGAVRNIASERFGYNATFSYPRRGGSQSIVDGLAAISRIPIERGAELISIDTAARICEFSNGDRVSYRTLVSTLPLPALLRLLHPVDSKQLERAAALRHNRVAYFAFGFRAQGVIPAQHWVYVPEPQYCMYRVGILSNYSPSVAPAGCVLVCAEVALAGDAGPTNMMELRDRARADLKSIGIVMPDWVSNFEHYGTIDCAYAIYDSHRRAVLPGIQDYLRSIGIMSIGRYGTWGYGSMGDALIEGRDCAQALNAQFASR